MLLLPDVITLSPKEMDIAKDNFKLFEQVGFMVEEFGENTIKLSGVPEICVQLQTKELFIEILDEINKVARIDQKEKERKLIEAIAKKISMNSKLVSTEEEVTAIMDQLLSFKEPFKGLDGKSSVIKMSKYDIEKKFARK